MTTDILTKDLIDQVFDPVVDKIPRVADLNLPLDPEDLSHYVKVPRRDEKIVGADVEVRALCGYAWTKQETASVNVYADARHLQMEVCPVCHVQYEQISGGRFAWGWRGHE